MSEIAKEMLVVRIRSMVRWALESRKVAKENPDWAITFNSRADCYLLCAKSLGNVVRCF